ncbi:MAG TPA: hypothetical protein VFO76_10525, partial [Candidatus Kapabacteria bacterium]|nr:hypothetical protein [Candidatus Kapabacteria bacterium]
DETNQALKLLGHSIGIVALGKKIVLIEGRESSLDKQVYGTLIKNKYPGLVLVPTGSKDEIKSFSSIFDKVLSRTIWGVNFFMLTDRDTLPLLPELDTIKHNSERFRLLKKYHLENYFLNENIWSEIFAEMEPADSWLTDPIKIRSKFKEYASESISYAVSLFISALIRTKIGNIDIMPKDCQNKSLEEIKLKLIEESKTELDRVRLNMLEEVISDDSKQLYNRLENSLNQDTEDWKDIIPGRPILHRFAAVTKLPIGRAKQLYLRMSERNGHNTFGDIFNIFEHFNNL